MLIAEQLSALPAIDIAVRRAKPLPTSRIRATIVGPMSLPVVAFNDFIWIWWGSLLRCSLGNEIGRAWSIIRLENIQTLELLVQNRQRLEFFGFDHLGLEPILDFILLDFFEVFVIVVKMSMRTQQPNPILSRRVSLPVELQQCDLSLVSEGCLKASHGDYHLLIANWTNEGRSCRCSSSFSISLITLVERYPCTYVLGIGRR